MGKDLLQDSISFSKGMIPQVDPINLPEGAYLDALNMMRNEVGVIMTECGTSSTAAIPGTHIVGVINADDEIVVCSTNGVTSYIGYLHSDDTYQQLCANDILKFNTTTKLSLEYKEDYKQSKILFIGGKGIKLRRIDLSTVSSITTADFDKLTSLFLEYELPITTVLDIKSGGEVKTGIYQFACRLVTDSGDVTGFGLVSELFPVIGESVTAPADVKVLDGAPPQSPSPNLLSVQISNIDTTFKYIEPCVITYLGEANILSIKSLGKKIITSNIMVINYTGTSEELDDILQEEIAVNDVQYTSGNYLTQKDSTLIIAGVEEEKVDYDWQSVANSIAVTWDTKPLVHDEPITPAGATGEGAGYDSGVSTQFDSYRNPKNAAKYKGYKRGEVYSFTFTPIVNGRVGKAYHIPAMRPEELNSLGFSTKLTSIVYTDASDASLKYPANFPKVVNTTLANSSIRYHKMPDNYTSPFVTVLGDQKEQHNVLYLKFNITSTTSWKSNCNGYIIGRENRRGKETIGAQGVCKRFYKYYNRNTYGIVPNFNSMIIHGTEDVNLHGPRQLNLRHLLYCAPDIITDSGNISYSPNYMRKLQRENMNIITLGSRGTNQDATWQCKPVATRVTGTIDRYPPTSLIPLESTVTIVKPSGNNNPMNGGSNISIGTHTGLDITVMRTSGGLVLTSTVDVPVAEPLTELWDDRDDWDGHGYNYNPNEYNNGRIALDMYELLIPSTNYYGNIYNKEAFTVGYKLKDDFTPESKDTITCFGGDTYISKYAMVFKDGPAHYGSVQETKKQAVPFSSGLYYFTLESQYNYYYRHYIVADGTVKGSTPYYPKQKNFDEVLNADISLGNAELYNKQYSAQNTLQTFYTSTVDEFVTAKFPNRIIYSATSVEGEKLDAYRFFKIHNYHDIPKQYGEITGLFTQGTDLYIHTEKALWKAFYNTLVTQASSAGEVVLGNGGAFSRPSVPLVSLQGGYAGCKDISASIGTPLGRFFYDYTKAKLYLLGEGLQEISNPAVFQLLRDTIGAGDVTLGYDYGRKRVLLSSSTGTLSFKPELQSFDSRHNYTFSHFISRGLKGYVISGNKMHYFDTTVIGRFFDTVYNSFIKVASVVSPSLSKRYVSAEVVLTSQDPVTKVNSPWAFFQKLKMYSRERNTGETLFTVNPSFGQLERFGEILVSKANNKFRFGFAPDIVDDINVDIQEPYNLKSHSRFSDSDRIFLPDMVDNHVILEFTIDNNQQKDIKIQSLIINFDQNIT